MSRSKMNQEKSSPRPVYDLALLDSLISRGLRSGAGGDEQGTVCVEQAVALCVGLPLTDNPKSCTAPAVREMGVRFNDRGWSSPEARSKGLRAFAFAQLGTAETLDERKWAKRVAELVIREVVPMAFRKVATLPRLAKHKDALEAAALKCEQEGTEASAREANRIAAYAADAADAAAADAAYAYAAAYATAAAYAAADAYAYAAAYAAAAYAYAADAAYAAADAYAYAAAYATAAYAVADAARSKYRDEMLTYVADIAVRAIQEQLGDAMVTPPGSAS